MQNHKSFLIKWILLIVTYMLEDCFRVMDIPTNSPSFYIYPFGFWQIKRKETTERFLSLIKFVGNGKFHNLGISSSLEDNLSFYFVYLVQVKICRTQKFFSTS